MANSWHWRWNAQAFAGAGYGVVMIDFHGSTGYGQAFTDSISGDWGGKPLEDLKLGLAAALKQYPWLDGDRMCALGGSYGGYMINWIAGQWPDRFKCLVTHDGIFDNRSMYYSTEELWFPEWENGGPEYLKPRGLRQAQSHRLRGEVEDADAGDSRSARLPRALRHRVSPSSPPYSGWACRASFCTFRTRITGC